MSNAINVTVPHKLTVEEAAERLSKGDNKPSFVGWLESLAVTTKLWKIVAEVEVTTLTGKVTLDVVIEDGRVIVESSPVSRVTEWVAESAIQAKLVEALK